MCRCGCRRRRGRRGASRRPSAAGCRSREDLGAGLRAVEAIGALPAPRPRPSAARGRRGGLVGHSHAGEATARAAGARAAPSGRSSRRAAADHPEPAALGVESPICRRPRLGCSTALLSSEPTVSTIRRRFVDTAAGFRRVGSLAVTPSRQDGGGEVGPPSGARGPRQPGASSEGQVLQCPSRRSKPPAPATTSRALHPGGALCPRPPSRPHPGRSTPLPQPPHRSAPRRRDHARARIERSTRPSSTSPPTVATSSTASATSTTSSDLPSPTAAAAAAGPSAMKNPSRPSRANRPGSADASCAPSASRSCAVRRSPPPCGNSTCSCTGPARYRRHLSRQDPGRCVRVV